MSRFNSKTSRSILILSLLAAFSAQAKDSLLDATKQAKSELAEQNQARENRFTADEQALIDLRDQLISQRDQLQINVQKLHQGFDQNDRLLAEQERQRDLESASLAELFAVVRQAGKTLQADLKNSVASIAAEKDIAAIDGIVDQDSLPSRAGLYALWRALSHQLAIGASIHSVQVPYIQADGQLIEKHVYRLGRFGLIDKGDPLDEKGAKDQLTKDKATKDKTRGYLNWQGNKIGARAYPRQPEALPEVGGSRDDGQLMTFDPTGGDLLQQLSATPTLWQRIEQGGVISQLILALLFSGLLIGLVQGAFLLSCRLKINRQLSERRVLNNNPLGRILRVYQADKSTNIEALELRLYETILDEQQRLERGLSLLKLLAGLSPMLGLLGTVTGMIETFQAITLFGNADPRMMAAGISTALVTTVLGLVSAMPLLFLHNVLSTQAANVRTLLEKQGIGLVAERAEQAMEAV